MGPTSTSGIARSSNSSPSRSRLWPPEGAIGHPPARISKARGLHVTASWLREPRLVDRREFAPFWLTIRSQMAAGVLEGRRACDARPEGSGECNSAAPVYSSTNSTLTASYVRFQTIAEDGGRERVQFLLSLALRYAALSKGAIRARRSQEFGITRRLPPLRSAHGVDQVNT